MARSIQTAPANEPGSAKVMTTSRPRSPQNAARVQPGRRERKSWSTRAPVVTPALASSPASSAAEAISSVPPGGWTGRQRVGLGLEPLPGAGSRVGVVGDPSARLRPRGAARRRSSAACRSRRSSAARACAVAFAPLPAGAGRDGGALGCRDAAVRLRSGAASRAVLREAARRALARWGRVRAGRRGRRDRRRRRAREDPCWESRSCALA